MLWSVSSEQQRGERQQVHASAVCQQQYSMEFQDIQPHRPFPLPVAHMGMRGPRSRETCTLGEQCWDCSWEGMLVETGSFPATSSMELHTWERDCMHTAQGGVSGKADSRACRNTA